ncbi:MAG TPA: AAA family ATPase [Firmicutes bacterium]|nr:AAA family ATPase [Bacillota bacterium]
MRIRELALQRYGPLPESGRRRLSGFNLFYGPNEAGKSLTIDALVKLLLGKEARSFEAIDRVKESPEGFLILEHEGEEWKLPEAGLLPHLLQVSTEECRNIFVVRDSDLAVDQEGDFYRDITHRLTGLRSAGLGKIREKLREKGRLTPGLDFQDTAPLKLKSNLRRAEQLVDRARELAGRLRKEGYDRVEQKAALLAMELREIERRLEQLEASRKGELYEKGSEALDILQSKLRESAAVQNFNSAVEAEWQRLQDDLQAGIKKEKQLRDALHQEKQLGRRAADAFKEAAEAVEEQRQRRRLLAERVEPLLQRWQALDCSLKGKESVSRERFFTYAAFFSALSFLLSLIGLLVRPAWWLYLLLAAAGGVLFTGAFCKLALLRGRSALAALNRELRFEAAGLGFSAAGPLELQKELAEFHRRLAALERERDERDKEAAVRKDIGERISTEIEEICFGITAAGDRLRQLKEGLTVGTLESYREKLRLKETLSAEIGQQRAILESHFGDAGAGNDLAEALAIWRERISGYLPFRGKNRGCPYSEARSAGLKKEREAILDEREDLDKRWEEYRSELQTIEKEFSELFVSFGRGILPCQTIPELEEATAVLNGEIEAAEKNKEAAAAAIAIFSEIEAEEETRIEELFGEESNVSAYFHRITEGRYREVIFDSAAKEIRVRCAGGSMLEGSRLSGGAADQLYFAIRLALGKRLLGGGTGFFILDDPFVKADPFRLTTLLGMLEQIVSQGWQVLYFSAKGEVKAALQEGIECGRVKLFTMAGDTAGAVPPGGRTTA